MLARSFSSILARVRRFLLVSTLIGLWLMSAMAAAQSRVAVAVLPFEGPGGTAARRSAIAALETEPRVTVTDEGIADAAAARTGAGPTGASGVSGFARQVQARIVIQGTLSGRGRGRRLTLTARDANGASIATEAARLRGGAAARHAISSALRSLLDTALASLPSDRPREHTVSQEEGVPELDEPTPAPSPTGAFGADPALLAMTISAGIRARDASIHLDDMTVRTYDASPYFELGGRVELRPLAHQQDYSRGLYAIAEAGGAIGLSSGVPGMPDARVSTTFYRLAASLGYLVPVGEIVEVGADFGGGYDAFQLANNGAMPTVEYPYLRPGVRARFRAIGETFVLGISGGYRALLGREGLGSAFGHSGGSFGWDLGGGISGAFDIGITYSLEAGFTQYAHSFDVPDPGFLGQGVRGTDGGYRLLVGLGYSVR